MCPKMKDRNTEMDVGELNLEELQHEHRLTLVDLQLMHRDYEEDDDTYSDSDLITTQNFKCTCNKCDRQIDWYHRYYYKCSMSSCHYSLHKFCENMPRTLQFQGHPSHTLILQKTTNDQKCHGCLKYHPDGICYHCSTCNYGVCQLCATFVEQNTIHHPSHPHPLISFTVEPILSKCFACGKKHEGRFYQCTTCFNFLVNSECLSLPMKLLLDTQQFSHRHLLTLSYSFLDQLYDFGCRICGMKFEDEHLIYKCSKCMFYVHPDCATQRIEPFISILLPGLGKTKKNFKDVDHPYLLHLPLDDESRQTEIQGETSPNIDHKHPRSVVLVDDKVDNDTTTSRVSALHDPMKRIKLLCTACTRPITKLPFYRCSIYANRCDFALHEWCTRLPKELKDHVGHPQHTLKLVNVADRKAFRCSICGLPCNGFSYRCVMKCNYWIDVNCGFMPEEITHEAHANHLLTRVDHVGASSSSLSKIECRACCVSIDETDTYFKCGSCDFYLDCRCALKLPKTIRHKFDKHPLKLSYSPIEEHKSQYFCEVCEEDLHPGKWFYHCVECAQSIHTACAPLILQSEQGVNSLYVEGVYKFINIKFGVVKKKWVHYHDVSFVPGTEHDGLCARCGKTLHSTPIWKCLHCKYARHYLVVCKYLHLSDETSYSYGFTKNFNLNYLHSFSGNKRMIKSRPQRNEEFYPSGTMRPVTQHWKVTDDLQR